MPSRWYVAHGRFRRPSWEQTFVNEYLKEA